MKRIISVILTFAIILCGLPLCLGIATNAQSSENLIANPSFEDGLDNWKLYNGNNVDFNVKVIEEESYEGEKSLYRYVGGTSSVYNQYAYSEFELKANTEYVLSFWIKGNPAWGRFYITDNCDPATLDHTNSDDKALWFQWTGQTYDNWTRLDYSFYANSNAKHNLYFYFSGAATNVYLDDFSLKEKFAKNMVENGSFSEGNSGWELDSSAFSVNEQNYLDVSAAYRKVAVQEVEFAGNYINMGFNGWLNQSVTLSKGVNYNISFDVFLPESITSGFDLELQIAKRVTYFGTERAVTIPFSGFNYGEEGWQTLTANILASSDLLNGGSSARFFVGIKSQSANGNIIIDNVKFGSLLINGDFESSGSLGWSIDSSSLTADRLLKGQNLKLSFRYKGMGFRNDVALWSLSTEKTFDPINTFVRGYITEDSAEWKEVSFVFNSGEYSKLYLLFQTMDNPYCLDNISIIPTTDAVTVTPLNRAYFVESMSGSYYEKYKQPASGRNIVANDDFLGTATSKTNDALSFISTSNGGKKAGTIVSNNEESGASYLGNSSLKFEAGNEEESVLIPLSLSKNTTYWMALYIKTDAYIADDEGFTRFSYGIADTTSGNFIRVEDLTSDHEINHVFSDKIQNTVRFDGKWHYVGIKFTTNGQTNLSFMLRGKRACVYVDKLYVWNSSNSHTTDFNATLDKVGPVKNIKVESTLLDISSGGTNLVSNSDFENGDEFWGQEYRRVGVYGNNLNIVNSGHMARGNAFLYENQLIYPWNCYYIKWIDVKPNTNYTFSAKFLVTKEGNGFFGICPGYKNTSEVCSATENMLFPSNGLNTWVAASEADMYIANWKFSSENMTSNGKWKTVGVTFNSGDRNRVGFFVQDGGGAAYIDDVKLFESRYAVVYSEETDTFPTSLLLKLGSGLILENGKIYGVSQNMSLAQITNQFEYGKFIRFFDLDGSEIKDLGIVAEAGMELRLMNGTSVIAKAVIGEMNILKNADFESGVNNWIIFKQSAWMSTDFISVSDDDHRSGEKSLHYTNGTGSSTYNRCIYQKVSLEPNSKYNLSFFMKGTPAWGSLSITSNFDVPYDLDTNKIFKKQWGSEVFSDWTKQDLTFFTDNRTEYIFILYFSGAATNVYFDDFLFVKDQNIITNGGFENGLDSWIVNAGNSYKPVNAEIVTDEKHSGNSSLNRCLTATIYNQTVYQNLKLKANAKYSLSFWIKGKPNYGRFFVSSVTDNPINRDFTMIDVQLTSTYNEWTKLEYTFTTTEQTDYILCLLFQSGGVDVYFDDFVIEVYKSKGDVSLNGFTNSEDLTLLRQYLIGVNKIVTSIDSYDILKDSKVNVLDLIRLKKILGNIA